MIDRGSWAYRPSEAFLKKIVGRADIEDALTRLEKLATEEARMAAAESLKAIHGVGNRVMGVDSKVYGVQHTLKTVEGRVKRVEGLLLGLEDMLQGVDDRVKDIGEKVIDGAPTTSNQMSTTSSTLIRLGVEKIRRDVPSDFETMTVVADGQESANMIENKTAVAETKVQSVDGTLSDVSEGTVVQDTVMTPNIRESVIDGAHIIHN